jgi:hypothetical protein
MSDDKSMMPHDKFIRKVSSKKENLISFLENALSKTYYDMIDVESINLSKETFIGNKYISKQLGNFYSDMIVNAKMNGKNTKIAILIEHKS